MGQMGQNRGQHYVFCHFAKFDSLVILDIAQDCSLGERLTSSTAETSKSGVNCGINWGRNDIFYSNVIERPINLACFL